MLPTINGGISTQGNMLLTSIIVLTAHLSSVAGDNQITIAKTRTMDEYCGLIAVPVNLNQKIVVIADSKEWKEGEECRLNMASLVREKQLYLAFTNYDITDCNMKVVVTWGKDRSNNEYTCDRKPTLLKEYHYKNESSVSITLTGANKNGKKFYLKFEISTNKILFISPTPATLLTTSPSLACSTTVSQTFLLALVVLATAGWRQALVE